MIEVEIQNFQSLRKTILKVDGFTGIGGRSNIGKSAIVRAIRCALTGAAGTDFVRHGEKCERRTKGNKKCSCHTTVRLECPQWKLTWEKGDLVNRYKFRKGDGPEETFDSVSRGTPDFLLPEFDSVKVGDSPQLLQVVGQFNPIFLLDQSGPAVADVLSDVAKLDNINLAMTLVNKDKKEAVSTQKVREKDIQSLLRSLEAYKDLDSVSSRVERVRTSYDTLGEKETRVEQLEEFIQQVQERLLQIRDLETAVGPALPSEEELEGRLNSYLALESFCSRATEVMKTIKGLSGVDKVKTPDHQELEEKARRHKDLSGFHARAVELESEIEPLSVGASVEPPDAEALKGAWSKAKELTSWFSKWDVLDSDLAPFSGVGSLELPGHPEGLGESLGRLRRLEAWVKEVRRIKGELRGKEVAEAPLPAVESLGEKLKHLALLEQAVAVEGELRSLEEDLEKSERVVQEVLGDFEGLGLCPTCSQPVQAGRCTMGGH